jgi:hypothetical protein
VRMNRFNWFRRCTHDNGYLSLGAVLT